MKSAERMPVQFHEMEAEGGRKCARCGGILVYEKYYGIGEPFWGWRCICCGDIVDQTILKNRARC